MKKGKSDTGGKGENKTPAPPQYGSLVRVGQGQLGATVTGDGLT